MPENTFLDVHDIERRVILVHKLVATEELSTLLRRLGGDLPISEGIGVSGRPRRTLFTARSILFFRHL